MIPAELRNRDQWICWHEEVRNGKPTKIPVAAHGGPGDASNPATWATYDEALEACDRRGYDGIGYVFSADDPYSGVDLDNVRDPDTGELEPWGANITLALDSYTEVSPSGTGLHIYVKGALPDGGRKRGPVEMYDSGRFFTITGEHLDGTPETVEERGEELTALHREIFSERESANGYVESGPGNDLSDAEVIARAGRAKNGGEFLKLWAGEINGYGSHSEADLALCSTLAFWSSGDGRRVDSLFRRSGLMRKKWDERRGSKSYGAATVDKALSGTVQFYEPKPVQTSDDGEPDSDKDQPVGTLLSEITSEEVRWLWPGRIPYGKLTLLEGDPAVGKSALTTGLAARVSAGLCMPDGTPCEAAGAVLCNAEDGEADTIKPRLEAAGGEPARVLTLSTAAVGDAERMLSLPGDVRLLENAIERVGAALAVVDPLAAFVDESVNMNIDHDVRRALAPLSKLAERTGCAVLAVRHLNKAPGGSAMYRGGGSIGVIGAARSAMLAAKHPDGDEFVLAMQKSNLSPPAPSLAYGLSASANGAVRAEYCGESPMDADALLKPPRDEEERSAQDEATAFLRESLKNGPVSTGEVKKEASAAGISWRSVERAKAALEIKSYKQGMEGGWAWALPQDRHDSLASSGVGGLRENQGEKEQGFPENHEDRQATHDSPGGR